MRIMLMTSTLLLGLMTASAFAQSELSPEGFPIVAPPPDHPLPVTAGNPPGAGGFGSPAPQPAAAGLPVGVSSSGIGVEAGVGAAAGGSIEAGQHSSEGGASR